MQDTQLSNVSPPHVTTETTTTIIDKDAFDLLSQNINPFTKDDLKKILD